MTSDQGRTALSREGPALSATLSRTEFMFDISWIAEVDATWFRVDQRGTYPIHTSTVLAAAERSESALERAFARLILAA